MTGKAIHGKAVDLLERIGEWRVGPTTGSDSDTARTQVEALGFIAEAVALVAAQLASQDS